MKSSQFLGENFVDDAHMVHQDHEVQMAREELYHSAEYALRLHKLLRNVDEAHGLEGWVSSKITLASDYLKTVLEYMEYELMTGYGQDMSQEVADLPVAESTQVVSENMPAAVIKLKKTLSTMSAEDLAKRFKDKSDDELRSMARRHGYGKNIDYYVNKKKQGQQSITENVEDNPVANAITRRIMIQRPDLLQKYGPVYVMQAIDDVADFVGSVEEIGTSDVSGWIQQVEKNLKDKINQYDEPMNDIDNLSEMTAGSVATVVNPTPKNKAKTGTLFGGTYQQKKPKGKQ